MIEKNVTQLDQDFITVWSKYFLNYFDYSDIQEEIRILAEQGQLNAIHSWYLANKIGDNYDIDNQITNLMLKSNHTYDELWAISTYLACHERNNLGRQEMEDEIKELNLKNDYFAFEKSYNPEDLDRVNELREQIRKFDSYKYRDEAIKRIRKSFIEGKLSNILLFQRQIEMEYGNSYIYIFKGATNLNAYGQFQDTILTAREVLKNSYKIDKTNDVLAYHLAKNIKLFAEVIPTSERELKLADNIFKKLSNRPLSIKQINRR